MYKTCHHRLLGLYVIFLCLLLMAGCGGGDSGTQDPPQFSSLQVLVPEAPGKKVLGSAPLTLDVSNTSQGYMVAKASDDGRRKSIQLIGRGGVDYNYFLESGETCVIPFSDGDGEYSIKCYQQIEGSQYCALMADSITVKLENPFYPYLYPNQYVNFSQDYDCCQMAQEMLPEDATDLDALTAIYSYVTDHVTYDEYKAQTVQPGYLPDVDETFHTGTGICFDYAALTAAMLRARDIPCRLIIGYAGTIKHAWIDVYIRNKGWVEQTISFDGETWERMDPTFYSNSTDTDFILSYIGDGENYNAQRAY